jgi:hypothetical protein
MAPHYNQDDSQERRRRNYEEYHPSLAERVTILEQKHKLQTEAIRNEMENMEAALKERIVELKQANESLTKAANELTLKVNELKIRSGIIASIAAIITAVGFFILEIFRRKVSGG